MSEQQAMEGLALRHYHFRWKAAKDYATRWHNGDYWAKVRLTFLETGGLFIGQLPLCEQWKYPAFGGSNAVFV